MRHLVRKLWQRLWRRPHFAILSDLANRPTNWRVIALEHDAATLRAVRRLAHVDHVQPCADRHGANDGRGQLEPLAHGRCFDDLIRRARKDGLQKRRPIHQRGRQPAERRHVSLEHDLRSPLTIRHLIGVEHVDQAALRQRLTHEHRILRRRVALAVYGDGVRLVRLVRRRGHDDHVLRRGIEAHQRSDVKLQGSRRFDRRNESQLP